MEWTQGLAGTVPGAVATGRQWGERPTRPPGRYRSRYRTASSRPWYLGHIHDKDAADPRGSICQNPMKEFMTIGKQLSSGSRRSFLKRASWGLTGSLIASGRLSGFSWAQESETSLKITKVEPHLLTGVRGYGPWLFVRVETADGIVGWGDRKRTRLNSSHL